MENSPGNNAGMAELTFNEKMLVAARAALLEATESQTQSSSLSSGGGMESAMRFRLAELTATVEKYERLVSAERGYNNRRTTPDFGGGCH